MNHYENQRLTELDFYLLINHMLKLYGYHLVINDLIETVCYINNVNISIIKKLRADIQTDISKIKPSKAELCNLWSRSGRSLRSLSKKLHIHPTTYHSMLDTELVILPKLSKDEFIEVKKFMDNVELLLTALTI